MKETTFNYADAIRTQRDYHGKPMQKFSINGKTIKTNYGSPDYPYWNGSDSDVPEKYSNFGTIKRLGFRQSATELLNELIESGYDEIRVVLVASGQIYGYCEEFFWACRSEHVKARRNELREEQKAKELEEAKETMVEAIKICCGFDQPEMTSETEEETIVPEKDYHVVEVNKSTLEKRDCGTWSGHGMSMDFKAGFNGFFKEDETYIYYATEIEPETSSGAEEAEEKEISHPDAENVTESATEREEDKNMAKERIWFTIRERGQTKSGIPLFEIFTDHPVADGESVIDVHSSDVPYKMAELTLMFEAQGYEVFFNATDINIPEDE